MPRETVTDGPRLIPGSVIERIPAQYNGLVSAYLDLRHEFSSSREDVARQTMADQDAAIDSHGQRIQHLALAAADRITTAVDYNPDGAGPHYLEIGSGYWYHIGERKLVQRKWKPNRLGIARPDFENAPEATPRDWYARGLQIADKLIEQYSRFRVGLLPRSLRALTAPTS